MEIKVFCFLILARICLAQEVPQEAPLIPQGNVRVSYSAPNGHYVVEDRSVDGTSILGNFGYQSSDGQSVGVAYGNDGAGFVIGAPSASSQVDQFAMSASAARQQQQQERQAFAPTTSVVSQQQERRTFTPFTSAPEPEQVVVVRGRVRNLRPIADLPIFPVESASEVPVGAVASPIDDIITELDQRQSTQFKRKQNRRRKQRKNRTQRPETQF